MAPDERTSIPTLRRHLVVVGMMAAGKTTFGKALAARVAVPYLDSDASIEAALDQPGRAVAERSGVEVLHVLEADTLTRQLEGATPCVITAAASVVESVTCREALADRSTVCWIDVPVEVLLERLGNDTNDTHRRSITEDEVRRRDASRRPRFEQMADVRVDGLAPMARRVALVVEHLEGLESTR